MWENLANHTVLYPSPASFGEYKRGDEDGANAAIDCIAMPLD